MMDYFYIVYGKCASEGFVYKRSEHQLCYLYQVYILYIKLDSSSVVL